MLRHHSPLIAGVKSHLISALESNPTISQTKQVLAGAIAAGLWSRDPFVSSRIIAALSGDLSLADLAFSTVNHPSAFAYNVLIRAHSSGPTHTHTLLLLLFRRMLRSGIYPDRFTFPFLLRASSSSETLHALALKHGLEQDPHVGTSLLHAYSSRGMIDSARNVFDEMPERSTVTWNAIISCYSKSTRKEYGFYMMGKMLSAGAILNPNTLVAALSCCAGVLLHGRAMHAVAARRGVLTAVEVGTSLVCMYARCGSVENGQKVFDGMSRRDASSWTAMIGGLAVHGRGREAVALFERMVREGGSPDSVTFTSVLYACSHSGMLEEGIRIFEEMKRVHGIEARMEHYGALVDMLGRAGQLDEAERLVKSMPFEPNCVVWGSLLSACLVHGVDQRLVERLKMRYLGLGLTEGEGAAPFYVGLSNACAEFRMWDEVGKIRERMMKQGVKKETGCSLF